MAMECCVGGVVIDYVTGREIPDTEDEPVRQMVEVYLVEQKGWDKADIEVGKTFDFEFENQNQTGRNDLLVSVSGRPFMALKCSRGSIVTRERESLAASRLAFDHIVPLTVVTNASDAEIIDTGTGEVLENGLSAIPSKEDARKKIDTFEPAGLTPGRREKEGRVYMAYQGFHCEAYCAC